MTGKTRQSGAEPPVGCVFTVGHSTRPLSEFIALLAARDIELLGDIRTVPRSRHNPQYNADALARDLPAAGIAYLPLPALGGLRRARPDSPNGGWRNASFRGFADYMQTPEFAAALAELIATSRTRRTAVMCAEAVPWRCHRSLVADALEIRGIPVIEILGERSERRHRLTPFARVEGTRLTYPPAPTP
ncbi:MAG: DUF488 domain-containing protein [Thermoanaerobaculaceae bacterium]|nr:DUF488 domain-containing protein [Thermoanaerobaculaceae bacterium]MDI9620381.1 DUF488 domain-containing protein [Acidobacteriota bacterium]HPW56479.1 DUF488 domain-containing protein [Thermoanaerobaculaceae bacterium]